MIHKIRHIKIYNSNFLLCLGTCSPQVQVEDRDAPAMEPKGIILTHVLWWNFIAYYRS